MKGLRLSKGYLFFLFIFLFPLVLWGADSTAYSLSRTVITVNGIKQGYTQLVEKRGSAPAGSPHKVKIPYTELESIQNLAVSYFDGKKSILLKPTDITDHSLLTSSFYAGIRSKTFSIPAKSTPTAFSYKYSLVAKELMFLAALPWYSELPTDTLEYVIHLPEHLDLLYRIDGDTISNGKFSVVQNHGSYTFRFVRDQATVYETFEPKEIPVIRLLVLEKQTAKTDAAAFNYFASWYHQMIAPHSILPDAMKELVLKEYGNRTPSAEEVFDFVKKNIHYIDIENGIGAIQPRPILDVFNNKQGDCKDMANLLCHLLRMMGYDAHLAISATLAHRFDLDFPSISSANHVICVLKQHGKWIYLDATERYGYFGKPSRQIQGRNILIVYPDHGELHYVQPVKASENLLSAKYQLHPAQNSFEGSAEFTLGGFQHYDLNYCRNYFSSAEFQTKATQYFNGHAPAINHLSVSCPTAVTDSGMVFGATVKTGKIITQVGLKNYVSCTFLPWPHELPSIVDTQATYTTYMHHAGNFEIKLEFEEAVKLVSAPTNNFSKEGFAFNFKVVQPNANSIVISYQCQVEHLIIDSSNIKNLIALNEAIQQTFSKAITYEKL